MESSPRESGVPVPVSDFSHNGAENQNTEGVVESIVEVEPEQYDFSSFFESDIFYDAFFEFKAMLESTPLPSSGPVVPEVVEELEVDQNMEQLVQNPPNPPQEPENIVRARRAPRLKWTKELHASFVDATIQLGGAFRATPKCILEIMQVEGLSLSQVKSHLQKFRQGGPSKPLASSQSPPPRNPRRRRSKPNEQEKGSLHLTMEVRKQLLRIVEAQIAYAKIAAERIAYAKIAAERMAPYTGKYLLAINPNTGELSFAADQNMGGNIFSENTFVNGAVMGPAATFNPYQLNLYDTYTSAAAINAGLSAHQLQGIEEAHPHLAFQPSVFTVAASGSYAQASNSASGESTGTEGMSASNM